MYPAPTGHSPAIGPGNAGPPALLPYGGHPGPRKTTHVPKHGTEPFVVDPAAALEGTDGLSDPTKHTQCVPNRRKLFVRRLLD
eukprot:scaffold662_cov364-Pavlova_lutheri.AAC.11